VDGKSLAAKHNASRPSSLNPIIETFQLIAITMMEAMSSLFFKYQRLLIGTKHSGSLQGNNEDATCVSGSMLNCL